MWRWNERRWEAANSTAHAMCTTDGRYYFADALYPNYLTIEEMKSFVEDLYPANPRLLPPEKQDGE